MPGTRKTGLLATLAKGAGTTEASISLLNELGIKNGEWCLESRPILDRTLEWFEHAPLFVRALAALKLHTLAYLPKAGGVFTKKGEGGKAQLHLDERRFGHCKRHGALLAITQTTNGKFVAIGPNHLRNVVNEGTERGFTQQEGRAPTPAEREELFVTPQHMRNVLGFMEELGICLRTDSEDTPLSELRQTEEGRKKLKTLSGDNKIRVYLYLRPKVSQVRQGTLESLPSDEKYNNQKHLYKTFLGLKLDKDVLDRLKPLYRAVVINCGLDVEPEAFLGDVEIQEAAANTLTSCDTFQKQQFQGLSSFIVAKIPTAAPQSSTVPNSPSPEQHPSSKAPAGGAVESTLAVRNSNGGSGKESMVNHSEETLTARAAEPHTPPSQGRQAGKPSPPERDRASRSAPPSAEEVLVSQPQKGNGRPKTTTELEPLAEAMRLRCAPTEMDVKRQFGACRDEVSDCTPAEAAVFITRVIQKGGKGVGHWSKYWLAATANHPGFSEWCGEERGFGGRKPVKAAESDRDILMRLRAGGVNG